MTIDSRHAGRHLASSCIALAAMVALGSCSKEEDNTNPPKVYFASDGSYEIALSDTITLQPRIIYDDDSQYEWLIDGKTVSTGLDYVFVPDSRRDYALMFRVSNALGSDTFGIAVSVVLKADFDSFDNFTPPSKSKLVLCPDTLPDAFRVQGLSFANGINADTTQWVGFAFSNVTKTQSTVASAAIGTAYIPGTTTANNYMAVNATAGAEVIFGQKFRPTSIDIANDNLVYLYSKFGYSHNDTVIAKAAGFADNFTVLFRALGPDGLPTGAEVRAALIDCEYDNPAKFIRKTEWLHVDLTGLGEAYGMVMEVETTQPTWPKLFCIDNLRLQD